MHYRKDIGRKFLTKYEQAGVSIKNGDLAIENIKANIFSTYNENVVSEIGSFGGEFKLGNETPFRIPVVASIFIALVYYVAGACGAGLKFGFVSMR